MQSSTSLSSLRGLLRSASSNCSLADLAGGESILTNLSSVDLQNFAALARQASMQSNVAGAVDQGTPSGSAPVSSQQLQWPGSCEASAPAAAAAPPQRSPPGALKSYGVPSSGESSDGLLLPENRQAMERLQMMTESPSVTSLVELVKSASATSLVDLLHSYSATNLASMAKEE